jgi:hypothetical protein
MRRYIYICLALAATTPSLLGQRNGQEDQLSRTSGAPGMHPSQQYQRTAPSHAPESPSERPQANITIQQQPAAPAARQNIPAARYSPLAAQGGYDRFRTPPWEAFRRAIVQKLNPQNSNLGVMWEQWRQEWLENAAANRYFWYAFWTTLILILSWFALAWIQLDRSRETWELAELAADALRYSEYCKRQAKHAITRYNEHIEKCNRVIESARSGLVTPETATLENYKRELVTLRNDNSALKLENEGLKAQLESKTAELQSFTARIAEVEKRVQAGNSKSSNAQLVDRIRRLEEQNRLLQQKANAKAATAPAEQAGAEEC